VCELVEARGNSKCVTCWSERLNKELTRARDAVVDS